MSDVMVQDLLAAMTDALLQDADGVNFEVMITDADVPFHEVETLIPVIEQLHTGFPVLTPDPAFRARLKADLTGEQYYPLVWRLRRLPPRVHMAAFMALIGGVFIIWRRRVGQTLFSSHDDLDVEEVIA